MTINNIAKALIEAQKEMGNATKDSSNPYFRSKYADLNSVREACIPALNKHGIAVIQPIVQIDGKNYVKTILLHESGETIEGTTEIIFAKLNDAQAQGSGITYARRYGLQSLVCIGAEDDDGNKASENGKTSNMQKLANIAAQDLKEIQEASAEDTFKGIKNMLESCASLDELEEIIEANKKDLAKLNKYHPNLFALLKQTKESMKSMLEEEEKQANQFIGN